MYLCICTSVYLVTGRGHRHSGTGIVALVSRSRSRTQSGDEGWCGVDPGLVVGLELVGVLELVVEQNRVVGLQQVVEVDR